MVMPIKDIEELFLKIFKVAVLVVMGIALVAVVVFLLTSLYQFSQSPKEPRPAQKAPVKQIELQDLKRFLIDKEKRDSGQWDSSRQRSGNRQTSLRFLEDATILFRCAGDFGKRVGENIEDPSDVVNAQRLENIRGYIERLADGSSLRGELWIKALCKFDCMALADNSIIELKREHKVKSVFYPIIEFHLAAWDKIQSDRVAFEQREENRVASERLSEAARVAKAKALAITCMISAASAFALFMMLAIYLLVAKIENNLREINESIRTKGL